MAFIKPDLEQVNRLETMLLPFLSLFWSHQNYSEIIFVTDQQVEFPSIETDIKTTAKKGIRNDLKWSVILTQELMNGFGFVCRWKTSHAWHFRMPISSNIYKMG